MNRLTTLILRTFALLFAAIALPADARAQTAKDLVGAWTLVSADYVNADGSRAPTFGTMPTGNLVFTGEGRFVWLFLNTDLPKFAGNSRLKGTPEENAAVVSGSLAAFGRYSLDGKDINLNIERSTFPNWTATTQKRTIIAFKGDEFTWSNPTASVGASAELAFKRTK